MLRGVYETEEDLSGLKSDGQIALRMPCDLLLLSLTKPHTSGGSLSFSSIVSYMQQCAEILEAGLSARLLEAKHICGCCSIGSHRCSHTNDSKPAVEAEAIVVAVAHHQINKHCKQHVVAYRYS